MIIAAPLKWQGWRRRKKPNAAETHNFGRLPPPCLFPCLPY
jgi:hypothetical protein